MLDGIGQTINVGDKVFHSGTRDIEPGVYEVVGVFKKMISVTGRWAKRHPSMRNATVRWFPNRVVVVTMNLNAIKIAQLWKERNAVVKSCSTDPFLNEMQNRWQDPRTER